MVVADYRELAGSEWKYNLNQRGKMKTKILVAMGILSCLATTAFARPREEPSETRRGFLQQDRSSQFDQMLERASNTYRTIVSAKDKEIPESVLSSAKCVAVFPRVLTGALVIGGMHGDGLASCKDANGQWSQPAAVSVRGGSLGLQVGATGAELVLFFVNEQAADALKQGKFNVGGELSAIAGRYGRTFEKGTAGIVSYARTTGAFVGASIEGTRIGRDRDELEEYYGETAEYQQILEGTSRPDTTGRTAAFVSLLPKG